MNPSHVTPKRPAMCWSRDYPRTVDQLIANHRHNFPIIVRVIRGYHDTDRLGKLHSLVEGQILQVYGYGQQERIHAKDRDGRELSFPLDIRLQLMSTGVVSGPDIAKLLTLRLERDHVESGNSLIGHVVSDEETTSTTVLPSSANEVNLTHVGLEQYLLAYEIKNGWLVYDVIHVIFDQLQATFVIAVDLEDGSTIDLWADYMAMYERSMRHYINQSPTTGFEGVIYSDWSGTCPPPSHSVQLPLKECSRDSIIRTTCQSSPPPSCDDDVIKEVPDQQQRTRQHNALSISDLNLTNSMTSLINRAGSSSSSQLGSGPLLSPIELLTLTPDETRPQKIIHKKVALRVHSNAQLIAHSATIHSRQSKRIESDYRQRRKHKNGNGTAEASAKRLPSDYRQPTWRWEMKA